MQRSIQPGDTITFDLPSRDVPAEKWDLIVVSAKLSTLVKEARVDRRGVMHVILKSDLDPERLGCSLDLFEQYLESCCAHRAGHTRSRASITDVIGVHGDR